MGSCACSIPSVPIVPDTSMQETVASVCKKVLSLLLRQPWSIVSVSRVQLWSENWRSISKQENVKTFQNNYFIPLRNMLFWPKWRTRLLKNRLMVVWQLGHQHCCVGVMFSTTIKIHGTLLMVKCTSKQTFHEFFWAGAKRFTIFSSKIVSVSPILISLRHGSKSKLRSSAFKQ